MNGRPLTIPWLADNAPALLEAWYPGTEGGDAVIGAGQIHTDLARTFVRAEVVGYDDFTRVGSMKEAKSQGVYRLEGKTYIVKDGDIMHILASG